MTLDDGPDPKVVCREEFLRVQPPALEFEDRGRFHHVDGHAERMRRPVIPTAVSTQDLGKCDRGREVAAAAGSDEWHTEMHSVLPYRPIERGLCAVGNESHISRMKVQPRPDGEYPTGSAVDARSNGFDPVDQLRRYLAWKDEGYWSSTGAASTSGMSSVLRYPSSVARVTASVVRPTRTRRATDR